MNNTINYQDRLPITHEMLAKMAYGGFITDFTIEKSSKFDAFYSPGLIESINSKIPKGLSEEETISKFDDAVSKEVLNYCLENYDSFIIDKKENLIGIKDGQETIILTLQEKSWRDAHSFIL